MGHMVTHRVFGYTMRYRRNLELHASLIRAVIMGENPAYRPFTNR
jgi:hypothetical protein